MSLLGEINKLREELHILISGSEEFSQQQVIDCSERLDKLIHAYLLEIQKETPNSEKTE